MPIQPELRPILWEKDTLRLLDQRRLPREEVYLTLKTAKEAAQSITDMVVRGAPAIGIAAAFGVVLSIMQHGDQADKIEQDFDCLAKSRPTAINLEHALTRMRRVWQSKGAGLDEILAQAKAIQLEDLESNLVMANAGMEVLHQSAIGKPFGVLTHCNTGSLATGGLGTALGIIKQSATSGLIDQIFATETRPWLQGSRLTAFELKYEGLDFQLLVEGAAASLFASGKVRWLIVGADRITANGDVANKVGTLGLAVLARHYGVKVMVAAPMTTIDFSLEAGDRIPIETRGGAEILAAAGYPKGAEVDVFNPVFDVTPAALIDIIVTDQGAVKPSRLGSLQH